MQAESPGRTLRTILLQLHAATIDVDVTAACADKLSRGRLAEQAIAPQGYEDNTHVLNAKKESPERILRNIWLQLHAASIDIDSTAA